MEPIPFINDYYDLLETTWSNFERACRGFRHQDYAQCIFHAHQTIEADFKAFLVKHGLKLLKTHDLVLIYEYARKYNFKLTLNKDELRELTKHYYATRYLNVRKRFKIDQKFATKI